ncbi:MULTISPECIES: hypothetical protein [Bacillus subtilis group]|uniref:hypothetical protein n=1 Tax=Bacillus subtilis group TaxID=653685 RepID=UPI00077A8FAE|nr:MULTISPECIES: hypothetical protein [Bacillus subtilis group]KXZ13241.1 hypothetical protein AXI57_15925 [Bacillus atrophaeus]MEC1666417.1 hypothetical protein [Bacillus mojavensis]MED4806354.1 hypothetical protein [Bacillus atrophaeus]UFD97619.1 hypothetical protein [Bacillus atrophaeus]GED04230.1 hypothetical protein BAT02nite_38740 [Bacillus atrophaeus]
MIFKLDHYINEERDPDYLLFIEKDIEPSRFEDELLELIEIIACIHFRFEQLVRDDICVAGKDIVFLLEKYYGFKNVTSEYMWLEKETRLPREEWYVFNEFRVGTNQVPVFQIDVYNAREACCGPEYRNLMINRLPLDKEFDNDIEKLGAFYVGEQH